jgi:hypothetical protein
MRILFLAALSLALPGCIARTAVDIVTLPVKAVGKTADVLTTSQSEADEKRGRALRKREECLGKEFRRAKQRGTAPDYDRCPEAEIRR